MRGRAFRDRDEDGCGCGGGGRLGKLRCKDEDSLNTAQTLDLGQLHMEGGELFTRAIFLDSTLMSCKL